MEELEEAIYEQAVFAAGLKAEDIPEETAARACQVILDSAGCILKGQRDSQAQMTEDERIIEMTRAMVSTELYEGNRMAVGHPACHILPLMFIQAESGKMTFETFVKNFVASYETASRWGKGIRFSHDVLGHGTVMISGAAAAEGLYRKCGAEEVYELLLLAGSLPEVSVWQAVYDGSALHDIYAGFSAVTAKKCLWLSRHGVRSTGKIVRSVFEKIMGAEIRPEEMKPQGGYLLDSNYFKVHTGCRFIHPFADLIQTELKRGLKKEEIREIHAYTYKKAARLTAQRVPDDLAAKFSVPVSLAVLLEKGELTFDSVRGCEIDENIAKWEGRIWLHEDETYNGLLPDVRAARVEIVLKSGERRVRETYHAAGDFDSPEPFTEQDVTDKFVKNTEGILTGYEQRRMIDMIVRKPDGSENCAAVFAPLYGRF